MEYHIVKLIVVGNDHSWFSDEEPIRRVEETCAEMHRLSQAPGYWLRLPILLIPATAEPFQLSSAGFVPGFIAGLQIFTSLSLMRLVGNAYDSAWWRLQVWEH